MDLDFSEINEDVAYIFRVYNSSNSACKNARYNAVLEEKIKAGISINKRYQ